MSLLKQDGWLNVLSGFGKRSDKTKATRADCPVFMTAEELNDIWVGDGLGKTVVSAIPEDMLRAGFSIAGDSEGKLIQEYKKRGFNKELTKALNWGRLQGGSLLVKNYKNSGNLEDPLPANPGELESLKAYSCNNITLNQTDIVTDPNNPYFDKVEWYNVQNINGVPKKIHASRCLEINGEDCPNDGRYDFTYRYWGLSIIQLGIDQLRNLEVSFQGIGNLMQEIVIGKYKLANLDKILASGEKGADMVYQRLEIINASKSIINAVLLGEGEEYTRDSITLGGIPDVVDRLMMMVSAVYQIPVARLFGRSPAGMNSTGESDLQNYYDKVESEQEENLQPVIRAIIADINKELKVVPETELAITFNPVWTPSQKDLITMRKDQSQTDKTYMEMGVLSAEEIGESRFTEDGYSFETTIKDGGK